MEETLSFIDAVGSGSGAGNVGSGSSAGDVGSGSDALGSVSDAGANKTTEGRREICGGVRRSRKRGVACLKKRRGWLVNHSCALYPANAMPIAHVLAQVRLVMYRRKITRNFQTAWKIRAGNDSITLSCFFDKVNNRFHKIYIFKRENAVRHEAMWGGTHIHESLTSIENRKFFPLFRTVIFIQSQIDRQTDRPTDRLTHL